MKYLPFDTLSGAWERIKTLEDENRQILVSMRLLTREFRKTVAEPRQIYLSLHKVNSGTVYVRWRKRGVCGRQPFMLMNTSNGEAFLMKQESLVKKLYQDFNYRALLLTLAHSLRIMEMKRLRKFLEDVGQVNSSRGV